MKKGLLKIFVIIMLIYGQQSIAQFTANDYKKIKLYPAIKKTLINPKKYNYISKDGISLVYFQNEEADIQSKSDSTIIVNKDGALNTPKANNDYTDGAVNPWVEGKLKIGKNSYDLFGSYIAEGFLQGVLYDKDNKAFGVLDWEFGNEIEAIVRTKTSSKTYKLKLLSMSNPNAEIEIIKKNLDELNKIINTNDKDTVAKVAPIGIAKSNDKKSTFLVNDFLHLQTISEEGKEQQLNKWGWILERRFKDKKNNSYSKYRQNRTALDRRIIITSTEKNDDNKNSYEITMCNIQYVKTFVDDAEKNGFTKVSDKNFYYKLTKLNNTITINTSLSEFNTQYYSIKFQ